jgi:hypothetical protein
MENNEQVRKARKRAILIGTLLIFSFLCFLYGLINNIRMKQERQLAIGVKARQQTCEAQSVELMKQLQEKEHQLMLALEEARRAKDFALEQATIAHEAHKKSLSKK